MLGDEEIHGASIYTPRVYHKEFVRIAVRGTGCAGAWVTTGTAPVRETDCRCIGQWWPRLNPANWGIGRPWR